MKTQNVAEIKLGGAKRKNGHKSDCTCHICENIRNKAKRGGYEEEAEKEELKRMGGSKKKNGHKPDCKCPICINMKNAKKRENYDKTISGGKKRKTRKIYKGGQDDETSEEISEEIGEENEEEQEELSDDKVFPNDGGKKRKGNNHKLACKCPICMNMRKKGKKGGQEPEQEQKSNVENQIENNESPASPSDYDELEKVINGGTRKHKKKGGKKTRTSKSRKH